MTESEGPGPDLVTVNQIAGVRLHSDITAQRRKLKYNIPTKIRINFDIFILQQHKERLQNK